MRQVTRQRKKQYIDIYELEQQDINNIVIDKRYNIVLVHKCCSNYKLIKNNMVMEEDFPHYSIFLLN